MLSGRIDPIKWRDGIQILVFKRGQDYVQLALEPMKIAKHAVVVDLLAPDHHPDAPLVLMRSLALPGQGDGMGRTEYSLNGHLIQCAESISRQDPAQMHPRR